MRLLPRLFLVFGLVIISESFHTTAGMPLPARGQDRIAAAEPAVSPHVSTTYLTAYIRDTALLHIYGFGQDSVPAYSDSLYAQRISSLETTIPLTCNEHVRKYIAFYTNHRRLMMSRIIGRGYDHFPALEAALKANGMPAELKNLAAIESALDTNALSRCGALGMWQFMPGTAKAYRLKVSTQVDERRNVQLSTNAAMKYLSALHAQYGDWLLALAAYNAGPGRVNQALKNTIVPKGRKKDFWAIMHKLPKETRDYVPGFIAMCYLTSYYTEHNLKAIDPQLYSAKLEEITIETEITVQELAKLLPLSAEEIMFFNPHTEKTNLIRKNDVLLLPAAVANQYTCTQPVVSR